FASGEVISTQFLTVIARGPARGTQTISAETALSRYSPRRQKSCPSGRVAPVVQCKQVCNQRRRFFGLVILHIKRRTELLKGVLSTLEHVEFHALHVDLYEVTAWQSEGVDRDERNDVPLARPRERNGAEVSGFAVIDRWNRYGAGAAAGCAVVCNDVVDG